MKLFKGISIIVGIVLSLSFIGCAHAGTILPLGDLEHLSNNLDDICRQFNDDDELLINIFHFLEQKELVEAKDRISINAKFNMTDNVAMCYLYFLCLEYFRSDRSTENYPGWPEEFRKVRSRTYKLIEYGKRALPYLGRIALYMENDLKKYSKAHPDIAIGTPAYLGLLLCMEKLSGKGLRCKDHDCLLEEDAVRSVIKKYLPNHTNKYSREEVLEAISQELSRRF